MDLEAMEEGPAGPRCRWPHRLTGRGGAVARVDHPAHRTEDRYRATAHRPGSVERSREPFWLCPRAVRAVAITRAPREGIWVTWCDRGCSDPRSGAVSSTR